MPLAPGSGRRRLRAQPSNRGGSRPARRAGHALPDGCALDGVELVLCPRWGLADTALGLVHLRFTEDPAGADPPAGPRRPAAGDGVVRGLAALRSVPPAAEWPIRVILDELFAPGAALPAGRQRAFSIVFRAADRAPSPRMGARYAAWPPDHQWLWALASATTEESFPPDPEDTAPFAGLVRLSADWRALVLRDGAAFIGLRAHRQDGQDFLDVARALVHTVYADVLALGVMQRLALHAYANRLAEVVGADLGAAGLTDLEHGFARLRATLWWDKVTAHGIGNALLLAFQDQNRLGALLERIRGDLDDSARLLATASTRRRDVALSAITLLGLPFGLVFAVGAVLGAGPLVLVWCLAASAVLVLALHAAPGVRDLSRDLVAQVLAQRHSGRGGTDGR